MVTLFYYVGIIHAVKKASDNTDMLAVTHKPESSILRLSPLFAVCLLLTVLGSGINVEDLRVNKV